jgi:transcriptional regulator with XRE-family HTH domain
VGKKTIYSEAYRHLVDRLRERRESLGHTQTALAKAIGWPQQKLSAVEIGSRRLDVMEYFTLTTALGLSRQAALNLVPEVPRGRGRKSGGPRGR